MWLLTVYEVPMTCFEGVERKINKYLHKWLGIPPSFTLVGLYIRSGQLLLPLSSVVEEITMAHILSRYKTALTKGRYRCAMRRCS